MAIYLKESIPFFSRHDLARADLEAVTVEISGSHSKPFLVTPWYKPPSASVDIFNSFETLITKIAQEDKASIILGDFNCNFLTTARDSRGHILEPILDEFQYK